MGRGNLLAETWKGAACTAQAPCSVDPLDPDTCSPCSLWFHTLLPTSGPCPSPGDVLPDFWTPWHRENGSSQPKCTASLPRSKPWRQPHSVLRPPVRTQSVCAMVWLTRVSPCTWGVAAGGRDLVCSGPQYRAWHVASHSKSLLSSWMLSHGGLTSVIDVVAMPERAGRAGKPSPGRPGQRPLGTRT